MSDVIVEAIIWLVTVPLVIGLIVIPGKLDRLNDQARATKDVLIAIRRELEKLNRNHR